MSKKVELKNETANSTETVLGEGFMYIWLNTNTGKFSRPFSKKDVEKYLNDKDLEQAKQYNWALIEYKSLNGAEFDFERFFTLIMIAERPEEGQKK